MAANRHNLGADAGEIRARLQQLYGANRFAFLGDDRSARASLDVSRLAGAGIVRAAFSTGFRFELEGLETPQGALVIFLREVGSVNVRTEQETVHCTPGHWIPFSAGQTRAVRAERGLKDIALQFDGETVSSSVRRWIGSGPDEPLRLEPRPFSPALAGRWNALASALQALARMPDCPPDVVRGLVDHGIGLLLDLHPHNFSRYRRSAPGVLDPEQIARLRQYIAQSLDTDITVATLARLTGMGTTSFFAAFRNAFGTTPGSFVRQQRLDRARWLLENSAMRIADIAAETGFASQSHLTSRLLAETGMTPRDHRRRRQLKAGGSLAASRQQLSGAPQHQDQPDQEPTGE